MKRFPKILASGCSLLASGLLFLNISQTPEASGQKLFIRSYNSTLKKS
jgi:hypothetical protein